MADDVRVSELECENDGRERDRHDDDALGSMCRPRNPLVRLGEHVVAALSQIDRPSNRREQRLTQPGF